MKNWRIWGAWAAGVALVAWLYRDYGVSFDEQVHLNYGDWIIAWYLSLGKVTSAVTAISCKYYGGLADTCMQALTNIGTIFWAWDHYEVRHFLNALLGLLGIHFSYRLGHLLGGKAAGLLAAGILLLTPRWFGHMFDNPKDVPFAVAYLAALYYMLRPVVQARPFAWRDTLFCGLALGAALGIRIGGILLGPCLALAVLASAYRTGTWSWRTLAVPLLGAMTLGWMIMLLFWPYAQQAPLTRPFEVMGYMAQNPWAGTVRFGGEHYPVSALPRSYLPVWLVIGLPEFYHLGLAGGLLLVVARTGRSLTKIRDYLPHLIVATAILFPAAIAIIKQSPLYDGFRHFLFVVPLLAVGAALGWKALWQQWSNRTFRGATVAIGALTAGLALYDLITLHPYQTCHFNRLFAGGLAQAGAKYDTDYWGQSYHAGADWILQNYPEGPLTVGVPYMAKRLGYYFNREGEIAQRRQMLLGWLGDHKQPTPAQAPRIQVVGPDWGGETFQAGRYDLFMSVTRTNIHESVAGTTLFVVQRQGVKLLEIKKPTGPQP